VAKTRETTIEVARFNRTIYDSGAPRFEAGKDYPLDEVTRRWVSRGAAKIVQMPAPKPQAEIEEQAPRMERAA
jgi:hypothetical protein